jgi:hypothetical protein
MSSRIRPHCTRFLLAASLLALAGPALAQGARPRAMACPDEGYESDRPTRCEIRTQALPVTGDLTVDATPNGGIAVRGWDRQEIELKAKVVANADTEQGAAAVLPQIRLVTDGGRIRTEGPDRGDGLQWSVSYELRVPARTSVDLHTVNGGITIEDLQGRLTFETRNGGIALTRVNGDVRGNTSNGGVRVLLDGNGWIGEGLDVETRNGGISIVAPEGYSAHLETGTVNGGVRVDFPVTVQGRSGRTLSTDLGSGGPTLRLRTVNGGVSIERR